MVAAAASALPPPPPPPSNGACNYQNHYHNDDNNDDDNERGAVARFQSSVDRSDVASEHRKDQVSILNAAEAALGADPRGRGRPPVSAMSFPWPHEQVSCFRDSLPAGPCFRPPGLAFRKKNTIKRDV